jgi:hypothetical protein
VQRYKEHQVAQAEKRHHMRQQWGTLVAELKV